MAERTEEEKYGPLSITAGSESVFDFYCELCRDDGINIEAEGYCVDCSEYLCKTCYAGHRRSRPTRHHVLLDKENMPKDTHLSHETVSKDISTKCTQHKGKTVEYYCKTHDDMGCSFCFAIGTHKSCTDTESIADKSEGLLDGQAYQSFIDELENLQLRTRDIIKLSRDNVSKTETYYSQAMKSITQYREEINRMLGTIENNLKIKAETWKSEDAKNMARLTDECSSTLEAVERIASELKLLHASKRVCQMYISMKAANRELNEIRTNLREAETQNNVVVYEFKLNTKLKEFLKDLDSLGQFIVQDRHNVTPSHVSVEDPKDIKATHTFNIIACSSDAFLHSSLTGSAVLSKNRLVIVDCNSNTVRLLLTQAITPICEVSSEPWDVAVISKVHVAVTLRSSRKILILRVTAALGLEREITVDGKCHGIAFSKDRLVVTYTNPIKLEIMDLRGNVIKRVVRNDEGCQLFSSPQYVCVSSDDETIYVSDKGRNTVTRLTFDGTVKSVYKDNELQGPGKVCVDHRGYVYVCGGESKNVHMLTTECVKIKVIITDTDRSAGGLYSVSHCRETDRLFVGMDDIVKVYQLS